MGKLEKWVVLGVLALIVGILAVSLTVDDPLRKDDVAFAAESDPDRAEAPEHSTSTTPPAAAAPSALLNTSLVAPAPQPTAAPEAAPSGIAGGAIPPGSILKTTEGLQESYMPDARFYTWRAGDSFPILAQRFYGDLARMATLRRLNEGRTDVQPGDRILVPVYDLDAAPVSTAASAPAAVEAAPAPVSIAASAPASSAAPAGGTRVHVVKEGESLWRIARQELGSGARWGEIYEANRDVLSSPEALHKGQRLRIP